MRRRLNLLVGATTSLVALAFVVPLALLVSELAEDRAMRPAELGTRTLAPAVALQPANLGALVDAAASGLEGPIGVVLPDGRRVGAPPPPGVVETVRERQRAEQLDVPGGRVAVVPVASGDGLGLVHALVPRTAIRRGVTAAWLVLGGLAVVLVGTAILLADLLARRTLAAVGRVEETAGRLAGGDLAARADVSDPPEIARVASVLGRLAERIAELLTAEREAAADLSHRLRTPLTPLRIDAEALPPSPRRDQLLADVDALEAEVSRVINAFRSPRSDLDRIQADATETVQERAAFWRPLAEDQDRPMSVTLPERATPVPVDANSLADAVDALLGNVFAHTPEGTAFEVWLGAEEDHVVLIVADRGPGWPDRVTVLQRGASAGRRSTGLGLDIARRVARSGGGALELEEADDGGAKVVLTLPWAARGSDGIERH